MYSVYDFDCALVVVTLLLPRDGAWRKTIEPQKLDSFSGPGPEIVERQRVAKGRAAQ